MAINNCCVISWLLVRFADTPGRRESEGSLKADFCQRLNAQMSSTRLTSKKTAPPDPPVGGTKVGGGEICEVTLLGIELSATIAGKNVKQSARLLGTH
jgi:hypothetical protein